MNLAKKKIIVTGLLNRRSIAYGIARACHEARAELAITYQSLAVKDRVAALAQELGCTQLLPCDVGDDAQITELAASLEGSWGTVDGVVHSVAFAPLQAMTGNFIDAVDREALQVATDISVYSLIGLAKALRPILSPDAALVTLSFLGAERAVPSYNVMGVAKAALETTVRYLASDLGPRGVRVNAISAGPVRTASSLAFGLIDESMAIVEREAPLRRNVSLSDIGNVATFLLSDASSAITGEVLHVDCGFHAIVHGLTSIGVEVPQH